MTIDLVHGVFNPTSVVLETTKRRLAKRRYSLNRFTWIGSEICPFEYTDDPEVVIILDVTLRTLQRTLEFAWQWAVEGQEYGGDRCDRLMTTPDRLRLLEGSEPLQPFTLRWRRIKLNANVGKAPVDVRSPETSPGLVLLFAAAQHPARVKAMDYEKRVGWVIPGLENTAVSSEPWQRALCVDFHCGTHQVMLRGQCYDHGGQLAVPTFQE